MYVFINLISVVKNQQNLGIKIINMYQFIDSKLSIVENDQTGVERAVPAEINSGKNT